MLFATSQVSTPPFLITWLPATCLTATYLLVFSFQLLCYPQTTALPTMPSTLGLVSALSVLTCYVSAQSNTSPVTGKLGDALVVTDNPTSLQYIATFPNSVNSTVRGTVAVVSVPDGTGVSFDVTISGLPEEGGPFRESIQMFYCSTISNGEFHSIPYSRPAGLCRWQLLWYSCSSRPFHPWRVPFLQRFCTSNLSGWRLVRKAWHGHQLRFFGSVSGQLPSLSLVTLIIGAVAT